MRSRPYIVWRQIVREIDHVRLRRHPVQDGLYLPEIDVRGSEIGEEHDVHAGILEGAVPGSVRIGVTDPGSACHDPPVSPRTSARKIPSPGLQARA